MREKKEIKILRIPNSEENVNNFALIETEFDINPPSILKRKQSNKKTKPRSFSPKLFKKFDFFMKNKLKGAFNNTEKSQENTERSSKMRKDSINRLKEQLSHSPNAWVKNLSLKITNLNTEPVENEETKNTIDYINMSKFSKNSPVGSPRNNKKEIIHLQTDSVIKEIKEADGNKNENNMHKKPLLTFNLSKKINTLKILREEGTLVRMSNMLKEYSKLEKNKAKDFKEKSIDTQNFYNSRLSSLRNSGNLESAKNFEKNKFDTSNERTKSKITETPQSKQSNLYDELPLPCPINTVTPSKKNTRRGSHFKNKISFRSENGSEFDSFPNSQQSIEHKLVSGNSFVKNHLKMDKIIQEKIYNKRKKLFSTIDNDFEDIPSERKNAEASIQRKIKRTNESRKNVIYNSPKVKKYTKDSGKKKLKDNNYGKVTTFVRDILKEKGLEKNYIGIEGDFYFNNLF